MTTVHESTNPVQFDVALRTSAAPRAYHAWLYDQHGIVTKFQGAIIFMADDTHVLTELEPDMLNWITIQGEIGLSEVQALRDTMAGGAARICTARTMGVA